MWDGPGQPRRGTTSSYAERKVLRRLSVCRGGAAFEAASQVCGEDVQGEVTGLLARLVDRSLVAVYQGPGARRHRLLEPVREFAGSLVSFPPCHAEPFPARDLPDRPQIAPPIDSTM